MRIKSLMKSDHSSVCATSDRLPISGSFFSVRAHTVKTLSGRLPAPLKCIDAVQSAVAKSFDEGCRDEIRFFEELVATPESRALRQRILRPNARPRKISDVPPNTLLRTIKRVGVIGAGTMGGGIAMCFANAGIPVILVDAAQAALDRGLATIPWQLTKRQSRRADSRPKQPRREWR